MNQFFGRNWYGNFLFLRRYQPTVIFPVFFGFITLVWKAFTEQGRRAWGAAIAAGAVFAVIIFSYFFLWTAALAWLACFVLVWFAAHHLEWPMVIKRLMPTVVFALPALAVYALMISHRDPAMDKKVAVINFTHAPDLYRAPVLIAVVAILLLVWAVKKWKVAWREPLVLLTISLALMPFAVFNQQVITGRSLEPVHYEMFSANYLSLLALILSLLILWRRRNLHFVRRVPGWMMALPVCAVICWGGFEMQQVASVFNERNVSRDLFVPVAKRLAELSAARGKSFPKRELVFSPDILVVSDNIAASAPQAPFWGSHVPVAAGLSWEQQQERYFQYLYYSGRPTSALELALKNNDLIAVASSFGYDRYNNTLIADFKPITAREIEDKVRQYGEYIAAFNREHAQRPVISYAVVDANSTFDFTNLDRWYMRDAGERVSSFMLYQLKLR